MRTKELVTLAFLTAMLYAGQIGLAFLPNIEVVSFLVIMYTLTYRKKVFYIIYAFALLEGLTYGFGIWWFMYLYVWSILALITMACKNVRSVTVWAVISGSFGLGFGLLCSIPYYITGGPGAGFSYWIAGIPYDILHCIGNFTVMIILYKPISTLFARYSIEM